MTSIVDLIHFEEGFRSRPYLCSERYPTVGYGFKLGAKLPLGYEFREFYDFELPEPAARVWLEEYLTDMQIKMTQNPVICPAYVRVEDDEPRKAVLISMAYQLGVEGMAKFTATLKHVANGHFADASESMLKSRWSRQTPKRAARHAEQMRTGEWAKDYK